MITLSSVENFAFLFFINASIPGFMLVALIQKAASKCSSVRGVLLPCFFCFVFYLTEQLLTNVGTPKYGGLEQCVQICKLQL
jgi:hypothetical protein